MLERLCDVIGVNVMNGLHPAIRQRHLLAASETIEHIGVEVASRREGYPSRSDDVAGMEHGSREPVSYYTRHNAVPELAVLLTGTSLVPEDDFTLREGDEVSIEIESIGTLTNGVQTV